MRIDTEIVKVTVYYFYKDEKEYLEEMGIWKLITSRLKANERIEVE